MPHFVKDVEEIRQRARQKIEDGAVTSTYTLDKDKVVEILNEALATEIVCVLRYMHHYFMATGVHGKAAADEFREHADEERNHADRIAERIQQLGGKPDFNPKSLLQRSVSHYIEGESLADMIREDLVAERVVIDVYREMIHYFGEKDPTTRILIEELLEEEEEHASDLSDLLYVVNPSTGETEVQDPGTEIGENKAEQRMDTGSSQKTNGNDRQRSAAQANSEEEDAEAEGILRVEPATPQSKSRNASASRTNGNSESRSKSPQRQSEARDQRRQPQPAHEPGITGRVMGRRGRNNLQPAEDDIAVGGQSGSSRSVKITNKNRKNRAA